MSLANELKKLKDLKDSGAITQQAYEQSRNRLLDDCVRRIEAIHDQKPLAHATAELPPSPSVQPAAPELHFSPPKHQEERVIAMGAGASGSTISSASREAGVVTQKENGHANHRIPDGGAGRIEAIQDQKPLTSATAELPPSPSVQPAAPELHFSPPKHQEERVIAMGAGGSGSTISSASRDSGVITQKENGHANHRITGSGVRTEGLSGGKPAQKVTWELPPIKVVHGTVQHIRFLPSEQKARFAAPTRIVEIKPSSSPATRQPTEIVPPSSSPGGRSAEITSIPPPAESEAGRVAPTSSSMMSSAPAAESRSSLLESDLSDADLIVRISSPSQSDTRTAAFPSSSSKDASVAAPVEIEQPVSPPSEVPAGQDANDCHLFESYYERRPVWARWGLPPVKVIRGVAQNVQLSIGNDNGQYAASVEVDGLRVEIDSASSIGIDPGDRLTLGGYERDGKLLALAYHNDSKGAHSDLGRLRNGYRFLYTIGWASLFAGLAAVVGTVILLIFRQRMGALASGFRGYVPYALSGLVSAAVSYFGVGLSFLGARAKEFYDAMNSSGIR